MGNAHTSDKPIKPLSPKHFCLCQKHAVLFAIGIHHTHPVHQQISKAIKSIKIKHHPKLGEIETFENEPGLSEPNVVKFHFFRGRDMNFKDTSVSQDTAKKPLQTGYRHFKTLKNSQGIAPGSSNFERILVNCRPSQPQHQIFPYTLLEVKNRVSKYGEFV